MIKKLGWLFSSLLLTACVTINIYFPAAAAEEAARTIVRDVLDVKEPEAQKPADPPGEQEKDHKDEKEQQGRYRPNRALVMIGNLLELAVPPAQAAQAANIEINTPAISKLRSAMDKRQVSLHPHYKAGAIGFDQQGRVSVRNISAVALKDRNRVKKLVADENKDRDSLYREIARANGHPEWEADIRSTFARIWIEEAPGGYWYNSGSGWKQK
ncbi:MAG: DUF1318 domain-containing protein [bacterium]